MPDDELDSLRHENAEHQRERLLGLRPVSGDQANWWLYLIESTTLAAARPDQNDEDRQQWASLATVMLDTALETEDLPNHEAIIRKANLSLTLSPYGRPDAFSPSLLPDVIVRDALAATGTSPQEAAAIKWALRAEDLDVMRTLRRARNLMTAAAQLATQVTDVHIKNELAAWQAVLPTLP